MKVQKLFESFHPFWYGPSFDQKIKQFIENDRFTNESLACQNESHRWAKKLLSHGIDVEIHNGFYFVAGDINNAIGHTWLEVEGVIFDPTSAQFDEVPNASYYDTHDYLDASEI